MTEEIFYYKTRQGNETIKIDDRKINIVPVWQFLMLA